MEPKYFLLANTHTKTIQGIPFEVIELDRGSLQEMSAELNELNALIKTTTVSLQKISPPELLTAMQGIGRISSKLSGCLAEIQPSATTTAAPSNSCGMTIGDRIQLARENLGMSHDDLAEKLDIHPGDVLAWEDGDDQPMAGMVIPLVNALKCDPMWLLTGESRHESSGCAETPQAPVKVTQDVNPISMPGIGKRIQKARVDKRMYTEELENAIGADEGEVFRWETEKTVPPALYIDKLAKVLDVSVTWLMTGKEVEVSHG
ncbi:helix-turn-helix domain-containing protein [Salmonella enterica]|nr:helix-turn-helix domain-containing protein [Salmonella enterica]EKC4914179.1 helix-turn-helix domain-containing protein [Salmonella enterica]EKJ3829440.1 helix-turn-helix domain-containing protein [Salmonella enterica]